jgi:hypothetical protein
MRHVTAAMRRLTRGDSMDQGIKLILIEALRSGDYKQCQEFLHKDDKFCCLGILCDIQGARWDHSSGEAYCRTLEGDAAFPPQTYRAGITNWEIQYLAKMNDNGKSFSEIADWIEANL